MDIYTTWLIFISAAALVLLLSGSVAGVLYYQNQKSRRYIMALEQASAVTGCGLIFFDRNNMFLDANSAARALLPDLFMVKNDRQDLSIETFFNYFYDHAADVEHGLVATLGQSIGSAEYNNFREVVRSPDDVLCAVEAQSLQDGGTNFIVTNVDQVKQREDYVLRLNQQNHELFEAIEATTSGIIITKADEKGNQVITFVNAAFCSMFDFEYEEILEQDILDLCRARGNDYVLGKLQEIIDQGSAGTIELQYISVDQTEYWYDMKLTPVCDEDDRLELYIGIVSDISELKSRESEVSKGQRLDALGQLAAGVAHDFNNVLSIIDGYTRLTIAANENNPKAVEYLEKIKTATDRGANLIKRMLTFSRHKIVDEDVIDLGEAIREQEQLLQPLLNASIKFNILCDCVPMYIECGQDTITQILMNLVVNGRDAMPQGGTLFVEVRKCGEQDLPRELRKDKEGRSFCMLAVADSGTGIEPDVLERIFDPFFTMKGKDQGTGLGLSMVYGLVKQNGGLIKVDTKIGQGTIMKLYFPLTDKLPKTVSGSFDNADEISFEGYTVLLAEDEPDLRELVGNMLEERGMKVLRAADGHEALYLEDDFEGKIDLLLTDIVMPELGGVELASMLSEFQPEMKIIFMSGYPAKGQNGQLDIPDNAAFIAKPIVHEALLRIIYNALTQGDQGRTGSQEVRTPRWQNEDVSTNPTPKEEYAS
jgi:two-component system cell cycle sensor histidine kinase/response regulator CckA